MRDGRIVADRPVTRQTTEEELVELLIGRAPSALPAAAVELSGIPLLDIVELRTRNTRDVSLHIGRGEIVGLYGVVGCGREEIGRALVGLHPVLGGRITFGGKSYAVRDPADALTQGVGFLAADRKQEGILPNRSIRENLTLSNSTGNGARRLHSTAC